ncbi:MAG: tRNA pseudouridine(55) synthase TruB [Ruminococcus sp.]|nr:tRNA pseudouridine(55) synthase TruB [Ruminococcus sp.]
MNGILIVNKPEGFTSFDVIAKLRGILKMRRLGHGGTLDPMATGVLPVFVGSATRACDIMPDNTKSYRAGFCFGQTTDTLDITGTVLTESDTGASRQEIEELLPQFRGDIMQLPPMYSAVQVDGKRLYDLARKGETVERTPRPAQVMRLEILSYDQEERQGELEIVCGKGTYIRTIISDIGEKLGCGGVMTSLVRTSSGGFSIEESHTLDEIQRAADEGRAEELILPIGRVFSSLKRLSLSQPQTKMYRNGVKLDLDRVRGVVPDCDTYAVYGSEGEFIGTARADRENGLLRVGKNLG